MMKDRIDAWRLDGVVIDYKVIDHFKGVVDVLRKERLRPPCLKNQNSGYVGVTDNLNIQFWCQAINSCSLSNGIVIAGHFGATHLLIL
jgi:hypothetical protein